MATLKINQAALTAAAITATITGAGAAIWYFTSAALSEVRDKVAQEKSALARLENRPNFPSENNIQEFERVINKIESDISEVRQSIRKSSVPGENIPGDVFQTRFARMKQQLTEACQDLGITIPENFQFSFSFYATNTPSRDDTLALTQQLTLVEKLSRILIEARVNRINSLTRMIVEKNLPAGVSLETSGGLTSISPAQNLNRDFFAPPPTNNQLVYTSMPFILEFESDENSLRRVINELSRPADPQAPQGTPYFIIRAVEITNSNTTLPTLDVLRAATSQQPGSSPRQANARIPNFVPGSISPVIVVGNEFLQTRLRVDYIQLKTTENRKPET